MAGLGLLGQQGDPLLGLRPGRLLQALPAFRVAMSGLLGLVGACPVTSRLLALCLLLIFLMALTLLVLATGAHADEPPAVPTETETVGDDFAAGVLSALIQENAALRRRRDALQRELVRSHRWFRRAMRHDPLGVTFLERAFLCIHHGEGAWTSNTGNGYFGGLQMDRQFQRTYGPEFYRAWGTADRWPRAVQVAVGIRAYLSGRGFRPWPNTARSCGVL